MYKSWVKFVWTLCHIRTTGGAYRSLYVHKRGLGTSKRGSPMALLMNEYVRKAEDPEQAVLDFLRSAWQAGVEKAEWNTSNLINSK